MTSTLVYAWNCNDWKPAAISASSIAWSTTPSARSDFLKALAHESRLVMLCILAEGEKSVSELEHELNLRQPTVSQQLARLRTDGLVSTRRDGKVIYYSLASEDARTIIGAIYDVFCKKVRKR